MLSATKSYRIRQSSILVVRKVPSKLTRKSALKIQVFFGSNSEILKQSTQTKFSSKRTVHHTKTCFRFSLMR